MTERVSAFLCILFSSLFSRNYPNLAHVQVMFKCCLQGRFLECNRVFTARTPTPCNIVRFFAHEMLNSLFASHSYNLYNKAMRE